MPEDLADAGTSGPDLVFANKLEGTSFQLIAEQVYKAEEVSDEDDMPEFGKWLPVILEDTEEQAWLVAVGELIDELDRLEEPTSKVVKITRCEKSGPSQTDPYEVNTEVVETNPQQRLSLDPEDYLG